MKPERPSGHRWYSHELCNYHDAGSGSAYLPVGPMIEPSHGFAADPDMRRAQALVITHGTMDRFQRITAREATDAELRTVHTGRLIDRVERLSALGNGDAGAYAPVTYHSAKAARLAAGAAIQAATDVMQDNGNAYCLIRPPGHHAEPDEAMALCLYNNVALAVRAAQGSGAGRVAVVDWDVHYGNGIAATFADDPMVLYVSVHQAGLFPPARGTVLETGGSDARGTELNVPLPPGSGDGAYQAVLDRVITPALRTFNPDIVVVAAGVDASGHDPMGRMLLTSRAFHSMTTAMVDLANELCDGRLVLVHEGGYSAWYQPLCVLATAAGLVGDPAPFDPFAHSLGNLPGQKLQPHQERVISHLERHHPLLYRPHAVSEMP